MHLLAFRRTGTPGASVQSLDLTLPEQTKCTIGSTFRFTRRSSGHLPHCAVEAMGKQLPRRVFLFDKCTRGPLYNRWLLNRVLVACGPKARGLPPAEMRSCAHLGGASGPPDDPAEHGHGVVAGLACVELRTCCCLSALLPASHASGHPEIQVCVVSTLT